MDVNAFLQWANHALMESDRAKEYLQGRGISVDQMATHSLGYVPGDYDVDSRQDPDHNEACTDREKKHLWCDSCRYRNWSSTWEAPEEGAPKVQRPGRRIADSVVFPLTSYSGQRVGFQIRSLERKEYDTFAIRRRPEGYFFCSPHNIAEIWSTGEASIVEGPGDHLVYERLVTPGVLGLTTSGASKLQLRFLKRFVKRIFLVLDMDKAGRDGVQSMVNHHGSDFDLVNVRYPCLQPKDKDPGDYWKRVGDDAFRRHFSRALSGA